jgi:hypothetical protein
MATQTTGRKNGAVGLTDKAEENAEVLAILGLLRNCLHRLDALGAQVPAVHLETCLHELARAYIAPEITSEGE